MFNTSVHVFMFCTFHLHASFILHCVIFICLYCLTVNLLEQRAPRKIGAEPIGLPPKKKNLITYLVTYLSMKSMGR